MNSYFPGFIVKEKDIINKSPKFIESKIYRKQKSITEIV